jgi:hypothetical protein
MPDNIRFANPDTMQKPPGYSRVVEFTGPSRTAYCGGLASVASSPSPPSAIVDAVPDFVWKMSG